MADDDTEPATPAQADDDTETKRTDRTDDGRGGVSIPSWMAAALVVVLALTIGAVGFALGRATDGGDDREFQPIGSASAGRPRRTRSPGWSERSRRPGLPG